MPLCDLTILLALVPAWRFPGWQLLCVLLAVPIVTWAAWPFHRATLRNLRARSLSMDTLVSLGAVVSFAWAIVVLVGGPSAAGYWIGFGPTPPGADAIYLDVAAGMVTFQLGGRYFETRSRRRAGDVLHAISGLAARSVLLRTPEGDVEVPAGRVRPGDVVIVRPGTAIPVDGTVEAGRSSIDTSTMTGEAAPVEVEPGSAVAAGTVNGAGALTLVAERVGQRTRLAQLAAIADEAQRRKARVTRLVDRVTRVFIPAVIVLAVLVTLGWLLAGAPVGAAIGVGIAVLIIACPCALGLATPTALMVGVGPRRPARHPREGPGRPGGERSHRHRGARQDGHRDDGRLHRAGRPPARRAVTQRPAAPGRSARAGVRARDRPGDLRRRRARSSAARARRGLRSAAAAWAPRASSAAAACSPAAAGCSASRASPCRPGSTRPSRQLEAAGRTLVLVAVDGVAAGVLGLADDVKPTAREADRPAAGDGPAHRAAHR